jgi:N,N'-diacetyllegionaminate synthase
MTAPTTPNMMQMTVGPQHPIFVIAEIGINHDGDVNCAHSLIDACAAAGADAVKFQTVSPDASYVPGTPSYEAFSSRTLTVDQYIALQRHAADRRVVFFTTPGDLPSLELCERLALPAVKISSGMLTNLPMLRRAAGLGVPLIMSTGGAYLWEVGRSVHELEHSGAHSIALLHCVSMYPAPAEDVQIRAMTVLAGVFPYPVGYSDHTLDSTACICAAALGASVIEKHVTLDRTRPGADHAIAAEPAELAQLVRQLRIAEQLLRGAGKRPAAGEHQFRERFRRRVVALADIAAGQTLTADLLGVMRPLEPKGLAPEFLDWVIGRRATRQLRRHEPIDLDAITHAD